MPKVKRLSAYSVQRYVKLTKPVIITAQKLPKNQMIKAGNNKRLKFYVNPCLGLFSKNVYVKASETRLSLASEAFSDTKNGHSHYYNKLILK